MLVWRLRRFVVEEPDKLRAWVDIIVSLVPVSVAVCTVVTQVAATPVVRMNACMIATDGKCALRVGIPCVLQRVVVNSRVVFDGGKVGKVELERRTRCR